MISAGRRRAPARRGPGSARGWGAGTLALCCGLVLGGCAPTAPPTDRTPTASTGAVTPSATPSPKPDFTVPGAARSMVNQLLAASGSTTAVLVDIRATEVSVGVVTDGRAQTWAYRDGTIQQVPSDLANVDQGPFSPDAFAFDDVGALFRAAAAVSGSDTNQDLQIVDRQLVDHDQADAVMTVSTNPESRTVFFRADGTLVPTLDFNTARGIAVGLRDAVGSRVSATTVAVGSAQGAFVEFPGPQLGTTVRRHRTARIAVTESLRNETDSLTSFDPRQVDAAVVWAVLQRTARGGFTATTDWTMTADARSALGVRLRFTVGGERVTTDLAGNVVQG